ncbi:MAG: ComF family protein [Alphaproteobacteria bacterium]|nr:ComF family protein [Alphaproteobacteria bacterium]
MFNTVQQLWQQGVNLVLPHRCPGCESYLPRQAALGFCASCYAQLPWWNPAQLLPPKLPRALTSFHAPLLYEPPLRETLLALKFADATHLAPLLARLLYPSLPIGPHTVLVPVPMHPQALRQRTYNQAALLVQELAKLSGLPCDVLSLRRVRAGEPQHTLTRAGRLRLSRRSFACGPALAGKTVILVDDIMTTGATLAACAGALKAAGVVAVHGRTLAYTRP